MHRFVTAYGVFDGNGRKDSAEKAAVVSANHTCRPLTDIPHAGDFPGCFLEQNC